MNATIQARFTPGFQQPLPQQPPIEGASPPETFRERVAAYERTLIVAALEAAGGNQTQAARALKIPLRTLVYKLRALGLRERGPASETKPKQQQLQDSNNKITA